MMGDEAPWALVPGPVLIGEDLHLLRLVVRPERAAFRTERAVARCHGGRGRADLDFRPAAMTGSGHHGRSHTSAELQRPRLRDQVVASPALVAFRSRQVEPGLFVDAARRLQLALRPEDQLLVAALSGEPDAFIDEA